MNEKESIMRSQQRFKSDLYNMPAVNINKVALSSGGNKRIQTFNCVKMYAYGTNNKIIEKNENFYHKKI